MSEAALPDRASLERIFEATRIVERSFPTIGQAGGTSPRLWMGVGSTWNGVVIFDSKRGKRVTDIVGTPTGFLLIHVSDALHGTVEYCDGTQLEAWPDDCMVVSIDDIVGAIHVG